MLACDPKGPLVIHIAKLYTKADCSAFDAFGRVFSGTAVPGLTVKVLGEGYTLDDEEDMAIRDITNLHVTEARYKVIAMQYNLFIASCIDIELHIRLLGFSLRYRRLWRVIGSYWRVLTPLSTRQRLSLMQKSVKHSSSSH